MTHVNKQRGFTIVELVLAMSFVSVLLLAIAMTIMQIGASYNRGMTVKEVNQASRAISEDFRYNISASPAFSPTDGSFLTVRSGSIDAGARLCLGNYSYIWNYGRAFETAGATLTAYDRVPAGRTNDVRLVRVPDGSKRYCEKQQNSDSPRYANIQTGDEVGAQELLRVGDRRLAVQNFSILSTDSMQDGTTGQRLYEIKFTIGSGAISSMNSDQTACLLPGNVNADLAYCVVQQFTLVIRAGNGVN